MSKIKLGLELAVMCLMTCSVSAYAAQYADGTYEAEAEGHNDTVKVAVTVKDGKICDVKVIQSKESPPLLEAAENKVGTYVVENNTIENIPAVTGASFSGRAIKSAVQKALAKAEIKK